MLDHEMAKSGRMVYLPDPVEESRMQCFDPETAANFLWDHVPEEICFILPEEDQMRDMGAEEVYDVYKDILCDC